MYSKLNKNNPYRTSCGTNGWIDNLYTVQTNVYSQSEGGGLT